MSRFSAKVTVDYWFDIDDDEIDNESDAEEWAMYNFSDYSHTAEIYDVQIDEDEYWEDEEE